MTSLQVKQNFRRKESLSLNSITTHDVYFNIRRITAMAEKKGVTHQDLIASIRRRYVDGTLKRVD